MTDPKQVAITVGEPNWAPLELVLPARELEDFMYMGRCRGDRVVQALAHAPLSQHQCGRPAVLPLFQRNVCRDHQS